MATRDIQPLELVQSEHPLVVGPYTKSRPQCLACFRLLSGDYHCPGCNFPMCGQDCADDPVHREECELFAAAGFRWGRGEEGEPLPMSLFLKASAFKPLPLSLCL